MKQKNKVKVETKKGLVLVFCAMLCCMGAPCAFRASTAYADQAIAVGLLEGGYKESCTVERLDGKKKTTTVDCSYRMELFPGDRIIKKPNTKAIRIQWMMEPYTSAKKINDQTLEIVFNPPGEKNSVLPSLTKFVSYLSKKSHVKARMATRGEERTGCLDAREASYQPGNGATLLEGYPVSFCWSMKDGKMFLLRDSREKEVYRKALNGKRWIVLTERDFTMASDETYHCIIEGNIKSVQFAVRLLGKENSDRIQGDLVRIDREEGITTEEKIIKKASYLQLISDLFPGEIDLYWLSYQYVDPLVKRIEKDLEKELDDRSKLVLELKDRFIEHLMKMD